MYSVHEWTSVFLFVSPVNSGIITVHARNFRNVSLCNINGKVRGHPTILVCFSKVWLVCFLVLHNPTLFSTFVVLHHDLLSVLDLLIVRYTMPLWFPTMICPVSYSIKCLCAWYPTMLRIDAPPCSVQCRVVLLLDSLDLMLFCPASLWYMYDSGEKISGWRGTICYIIQ